MYNYHVTRTAKGSRLETPKTWFLEVILNQDQSPRTKEGEHDREREAVQPLPLGCFYVVFDVWLSNVWMLSEGLSEVWSEVFSNFVRPLSEFCPIFFWIVVWNLSEFCLEVCLSFCLNFLSDVDTKPKFTGLWLSELPLSLVSILSEHCLNLWSERLPEFCLKLIWTACVKLGFNNCIVFRKLADSVSGSVIHAYGQPLHHILPTLVEQILRLSFALIHIPTH